MKKVRFLCSVAGVNYTYGKDAEALLTDSDANSEINAGNAVYVDDKDIPQGLVRPKRRPEVNVPEVHTTVIKTNDAPIRKTTSKKRTPAGNTITKKRK